MAQERGLLAQELHDSIAQSLAFLKIQVAVAARRPAARATPRPWSAWSASSMSACARAMPTCASCWSTSAPAPTTEDIEPALRTTLSKFEHQTGLAARLEIEGDGLALAPTSRCRYFTSCRRRCPTCASTRVPACGPACRAVAAGGSRCSDDGGGFDATSAVGDETHVGLRIMQETRAAHRRHGSGSASAPGRGCTVVLELPADNRWPTPSGARPL